MASTDGTTNTSPKPRLTNGEVLLQAEFMLGQVRESLNRILTLSGPSPERLNKVTEYRSLQHQLLETLQRLKVVDTSLESAALENLTLRREERVNRISGLERIIQRSKTNAKPDSASDSAQEKRDALESATLESDRLTQEISALQQEILDKVQRQRSALADGEALVLLDNASTLVRDVGAFEKEQQRGLLINAGSAINFASDTLHFEQARGYHRTLATKTLVLMVVIAVGGAFAVMLLFADLTLECTGGFTGVVEHFTMIERVVLAGVGRVAVLALIAWALAFTGGLHRSHAAQAVLYQDRMAALGVVNNLMHSTTELTQKHDLLKGVLRGYLGFDQNAFRIESGPRNNRKPKSAAGQAKELADAVAPLVEMVGKINK